MWKKFKSVSSHGWFDIIDFDIYFHFRSKLRTMLQVSNLYRVQLILGKAKETDMHAECAILYGKVSMDCKICELATDRYRKFK